MKKRLTFEEHKKRLLEDEEFRTAYEQGKPEYELMRQLIIARIAKKKTQAALAKLLHTKQPAIARLENGGFNTASIDTLIAYAKALGYELQLNLVPIEQNAEQSTTQL